MKFNKLLVFLFLSGISIYLSTLHSQVTIGSSASPLSGALLDLKETNNTTGGATASRGMGLPRVKLTNPTALYPMLTDPNATDAGYKLSHTGLMVYNIKGGVMCPGVYVWDSQKWNLLGEDCLLLSVDRNYIDVPSGRDLRTLTPQTINISWMPQSFKPTWTVSASAPLAMIGATVTPASPLTTSPTAMVFTATAMTAAEVTQANPWKSKESLINITLTDGAGKTVTEKVTINQTNYAMHLNGYAKDSILLLKDDAQKSFIIKANTEWTASVSDPKSIFAIGGRAPAPLSGGTELRNSTSASTTFKLQAVNSYSNKKYETADVVFKDKAASKRYNDIKLTTVYCMGNAADATLAVGVQSHKDQQNNTFYSALFGTAGRWMVTNLEATVYATSRSDYSVKYNNGGLSNAGFHEADERSRWAYPGTPGGTDPTFYQNTKNAGVLYNYSAATGYKCLYNTTDFAGYFVPGEFYPNVFPIEVGWGAQKKIQGMCPTGWHLPSDYEWTELENELKKSTANYSYTPNIGGGFIFQNTDVNVPQNTLRNQLGTPMIDGCEAFDRSEYRGTSLPYNKGGFAVLLVGYGYGTFPMIPSIDVGKSAYFWTSSTTDVGANWNVARGVRGSSSKLERVRAHRNGYYSVRCKQD